MANKFLTNVELDAGLVDSSNSTGTSGYLLSSTGTATSWVDPAAVSVGESEQVHIACKNTSGVAISKGDPVYITGTVGTSFKIEIAKADASNSAKMPAVGLAETDLAINAEGFVIVSGVLKNLTTDPLSTSDGTPSSNDTVYVKAGGGLTKTKPTGSGNLIQNVGKVGRVNSANAGSLAVSTIMRTNDVPNLTTGKIWVGSSTYTTESGVVHLDETNTRMGIGTTSPIGNLHIVGNNTNPAMTTSALVVEQGDGAKILIDGNDIDAASGMLYLNDYSTNDVVFGGQIRVGGGGSPVGNSWFANGNVGIGTTSPASALHINQTYPQVRLQSTGDDTYTNIGSGTHYMVWDIINPLTNTYQWRSGGSAQMTINTSGNVGVGTTSPGTKLDVTGTGRFTSVLYTNSSSTSTVGIVGKSQANGWGARYDSNSANYSGFYFDNNNDSSMILRDDVGNVNVWLKSDSSSYLNGGNVGIGTTAPSQKLHVAGNGLVTGTFYLGDTNCAMFRYYSALIITNSGATTINLGGGPGNVNNNVFVGNGFLDVNGYIRGKNYFYLEDAFGTLRTTLRSESTYATLDNGTNTLNTIANAHIFLRSTTEIMRVHTNNNVGIGTSSPGEKLEVNGTIKATATTDAYKGYIKQAYNCSPLMKTPTSAYNFVPFTSTIFTSTADYYNRMVAPYDGRVKKVILKHTGGATPTATNVNFKKHINDVTSSTIYTGTVTGGAAAGMQAEYNFNNSDFTFSDGDTIGVLIQGTGIGTTKTLGGMSVQIIVEYNIT